MKQKFKSILLLLAAPICTNISSAQVQVRTWVDVTDKYVKNSNYEQNFNYWEGDTLDCSNTFHTAQNRENKFEVHQELTGLEPGQYRLSVKGFYRSSTPEEDYSRFSNKESKFQYAKLYARSSKKEVSTPLVFCSSGAVEDSFGGETSYISSSSWFSWWAYYLPNNEEAARCWFNEGFYNNELSDIEVQEDGKLKIGIRKQMKIIKDWTCFSDWKLEFYGLVDVATPSTIQFSEIMPANIDMFIDPSFNYGAFVEFYNPSDKLITLGNCYLSNDPDNLKKWQIPTRIAESMKPKSYITFWFDNYDKYYSPNQVPFDLDVDGGTIYLSDPEGNIIVSQEYPAAIRRCSYARKSDTKDEWEWNGVPTPSAKNNPNTFATEQLEKPEVDKKGQVFASTLTINVAIPEGVTLRFTTDGSTPTLTNGNTNKNGKFFIARSTAYRFRFFKDGYLPSDVTTCSYIHDDYDFNVPILSVVSDERNITGSEYGILTQGIGNGRPGRGQSMPCNWNMDWERPVSMEYFENGKEVCFSQEVNMSACGGWSRAWEPHSFKLKANKVYGLKYMPYAFFEEKPYIKNKTLQIRNGGNDYQCRVIDPVIQNMIQSSGINVDCQSYKPVFVYFNGQIYNVLNMREPNNKHFAYANRGLDDNEMDQFEMSPDSGYVQMEGTKEKFREWYNLAKTANDDASYQAIKKIVDIDEYINYMAIELSLGGTDWPQNNVKAYRPRVEDGKFRFVIFDLDFAFDTNSPFTTFANKQRHTFATQLGKGVDGKTITTEIEFVTIFLNMLNNESFRKQFIDTYCLVVGSVFEPTRCQEIINRLTERARRAISQVSYYYSQSENQLRNSFTSSQQKSMINTMKNYSKMKLSNTESINVSISNKDNEQARILINNLPVPTNKFSGTLFLPITVKAIAPAGYEFAGWKDGNKTVSYVQELNLTTNSSRNLEATYRKITSKNQISPIRINEVSAGNSMYVNDYFKKEDWIELYNTTDQAIDLEGAYLSDNLKKPFKYQIQKAEGVSTTIEPHGYRIIWCDKQNAISQLHASFKLGNDDASFVMITAADSAWSDTLQYNTHGGEWSIGRYPDGGNTVYAMFVPTIGYSNTVSTFDSIHVQLTPDEALGIDETEREIMVKEEGDFVTYNLQGIRVDKDYKGIVIRKGKKYIQQ